MDKLAQRRSRRARWTAAIAVTVVMLAGAAGIAWWQAAQPTDAASPANVTDDGDGVALGSGPVTVEVYFDLLCPACRQFDAVARPMLDGYLADGVITLVYRPIAILDRASTTRYSTRAASATGCAADEGGIGQFVAAMMIHQPAEGTAGLSNAEIADIGTGVGFDGTFGRCVNDERYEAWATANTDAAIDRGIAGTPTVFVGEERVDPLTLEGLAAAIENAAAQ